MSSFLIILASTINNIKNKRKVLSQEAMAEAGLGTGWEAEVEKEVRDTAGNGGSHCRRVLATEDSIRPALRRKWRDIRSQMEAGIAGG